MGDDLYGIDLAGCRRRQQRLLAEMERTGLELVLLTRRESVQWLTGIYLPPRLAPAAAIDVSGQVTLVLPSRQASLECAADKVVSYEEKWHSTLRDEQRAASNEVLLSAIQRSHGRIGGEWSQLGPRLLAEFGRDVENVEPLMFRLRRCKQSDELRMLQRANDANRAMFALARKIIEPGVNELEVFNQLQAAAVLELGEALTYFGQDFRSNARGGLPRNRQIREGELYILDLGVGFRGYHSDNARTISVSGQPTDEQQLAWQRIVEVFPLIESTVRPGASCRSLFEEVQSLLDRSAPWVFNHHLGHGVGLAPHEGPHLNPRWDDLFAEGDFFAVEPGLYHDSLQHGIRLEENYVVTADGVRRLTDYPLEL
jgi:Xaa-Pro dipeptidase